MADDQDIRLVLSHFRPSFERTINFRTGMTYYPRFNRYPAEIVNRLMRITAARAVIDGARILPAQEDELRRKALVRDHPLLNSDRRERAPDHRGRTRGQRRTRADNKSQA